MIRRSYSADFFVLYPRVVIHARNYTNSLLRGTQEWLSSKVCTVPTQTTANALSASDILSFLSNIRLQAGCTYFIFN
jgi:hypothetical protein